MIQQQAATLARTVVIDVRFVPAVKLPTVFLTAVCVAVFYLLVRRLFGDRIGLVAAILLALDPLYLAHSRILHHDALVTSFMTLSALGAMVYFVGRGPRGFYKVVIDEEELLLNPEVFSKECELIDG